MKTFPAFWAGTAALYLFLTAFSSTAGDSTLSAGTGSKATRGLPSLQVHIQAKFIEISNKEVLKIGISFPTDITCLGFLAGIPCITNVFTITNTWQSLDLDNFLKINRKSNSVKYAKKTADTKHLGLIKLKKGTCSLKIKNKWVGHEHIPKLMDLPLTMTPGIETKDLYITIKVLEQLAAEKIITINYSVSPKGVMKIKTAN